MGMKYLIAVIIPMILAMCITFVLDTMLYASNHEDNHDTVIILICTM